MLISGNTLMAPGLQLTLAIVSGGTSHSEFPCVLPAPLPIPSLIFGSLANAAPPTLGRIRETTAGICQRARHQGNHRLFPLIAVASPLIPLAEDGAGEDEEKEVEEKKGKKDSKTCLTSLPLFPLLRRS